ncbi:hypothetical protein OROGR_001601 [Orobanche gracilis]
MLAKSSSSPVRRGRGRPKKVHRSVVAKKIATTTCRGSGRGKITTTLRSRGRPKKMKDMEIIISEDRQVPVVESSFLVDEGVDRLDCVFRRARVVLEAGKRAGMVFSCSDEDAFEGCVDFLRANQLTRYGEALR